MAIPSTRMERKREVNRNALLRSAATLFADAGFEVTSMDDIAAMADLTKRTLYQYFSSKEELIFAVAGDLISSYRLFVAPSSQGGNAHQRLSDFVASFYGVIKTHPGEAAIMDSALSLRSAARARRETASTSAGLQAFDLALGELYRTFVDAVAEGCEDGSMEKSLDPEGAAFTVFFLIKGYLGLIAGSEESIKKSSDIETRDKLAMYSLGLVMKGMKSQ